MNYRVLKYSVIGLIAFAKNQTPRGKLCTCLRVDQDCCNECPLVNHNVKTKAFGQGASGVMYVTLS